MVLSITAKYDLSRIVDPTIELWSAYDNFEPSSGKNCEPTVDYWFSSKELDFFYKSEVPLKESSSIIEVVTPTSTDNLSCPSHSENSHEPFDFVFEYSFLKAAREFWSLQETLVNRGLQESALTSAREFCQMQNKSLTSGLNDFALLASNEFWKSQYSLVSTSVQDSAQIAAHGSQSTQETLLCTGLSDNFVLLSRDFWKHEEPLAVRGIGDLALECFRDFWRINPVESLREQETFSALSAPGLTDNILIAYRSFWKVQSVTDIDGISDKAVLTFSEFWRLQDLFVSTAIKEARTFEDEILSEINECSKLCDGPNTVVDGNIVVSLQSLHMNMASTLQRKELNFEMTNKFKREEHLKEVGNLNKVIEKLQKEKSQWITSHQVLTKQLAQKDKQLEVVDEMISHNIDLELANEELNKKWTKAAAQLKIADSIETENYELIFANAKLTSEKQQLISNFTKRQDELITSNANLHVLVLSMEKAAERNFDESCKLQSIIEMLKKKDAKCSSPPSSTHSTESGFGAGSTRSRGSRRGRSFSRRSNNSLLCQARVESSLVPPTSAGMIYVNS
ncbi:hypothetical protein ZYGR_0I05580 [Zygosaccharomyces rouxii]|uniref:ZYRO0C13266p n=2 Tax=Zygosaccharomyces rouxii TaxID=4956 RepID=C5DU23_ZYGRC|nr:uncharacterized protein ZYRO0C13266g [Zygosaccharomyces rouxii]KAH9201540.1 hypothetical protein LQ764DRAFT_81287 [Zygosaccharomyces rouxii]GAV48261.1 hypothetical protein ZYGR_0I05580 [Zygosaccharomyces rouxii]CAR27284.1 ZYRO0C13266p [Zygosaccharomyces rouxii]